MSQRPLIHLVEKFSFSVPPWMAPLAYLPSLDPMVTGCKHSRYTAGSQSHPRFSHFSVQTGARLNPAPLLSVRIDTISLQFMTMSLEGLLLSHRTLWFLDLPSRSRPFPQTSKLFSLPHSQMRP